MLPRLGGAGLVFEEQRGGAGAGEQGEPGDRASVEGKRGGQVVQGLRGS